jgi:hypothetical protein
MWWKMFKSVKKKDGLNLSRYRKKYPPLGRCNCLLSMDTSVLILLLYLGDKAS